MKRILVALDSSPAARAVLEAGLDMARRTGAKVRLLRAVALPPDLPSNAWAVPPNHLVDGPMETAMRDLREIAATIPEELLDGATAEVGVAWDAICSYAREHDVELIVIGSHDYRLIDRLVGTTAAKVVNHADRPVLVVRPRAAA